MRGYADPEVDDASEIDREYATPHKCQDCHNKHPAGRVRDVPDWIFPGVKDVLVGVVNPESKFLHSNLAELLKYIAVIRSLILIGLVTRFGRRHGVRSQVVQSDFYTSPPNRRGFKSFNPWGSDSPWPQLPGSKCGLHLP
jgi:hypothetical protein